MKAIAPKPVKTIQRDVSPYILANQYLYHEFLKIFRDVKDKSFRRKMRQSLYHMRQRDGDDTYWLLVAAIAEGWRVKMVYRLLTNPGYQWNLEVRKIADLTMTGFNPRIVDRLILRSHRNFYQFADYYHRHPEFFNKYMPNLVPRPERDSHPVFVFWDSRERTLRLFDGMRRTVLAAADGKKTIEAYVGYPVAKRKPMVNLDKIHYFKLLFADAKKNKANYQAFVRVGREMVRQSRNGAKAFCDSLKPWPDAMSKKFIKDILKR